MSVIERVKIEQTVDVFQTIKLIRAKRPGAVNTLVRLAPFLFTFIFIKGRYKGKILLVGLGVTYFYYYVVDQLKHCLHFFGFRL